MNDARLSLVTSVLWRRNDSNALDLCRILCDRDWITREVNVQVMIGNSMRRVMVIHDDAGRWWRDREEVAGLDDAVDGGAGRKDLTGDEPRAAVSSDRLLDP
ncbi:MAG: putative glycolipid-binding domain-containing protein [Gemmatimonadota bacterium]